MLMIYNSQMVQPAVIRPWVISVSLVIMWSEYQLWSTPAFSFLVLEPFKIITQRNTMAHKLSHCRILSCKCKLQTFATNNHDQSISVIMSICVPLCQPHHHPWTFFCLLCVHVTFNTIPSPVSTSHIYFGFLIPLK